MKSDYAARAVLGLALNFQSAKALRAEDLAKRQHIPAKYLVQILIELKSQNIVKSVRGKEGGYRLAKVPSEITLGDVIRCIHGAVFESPGAELGDVAPELQKAWRSLQDSLDQAADAINFQDLLEERQKSQEMYYI